MASLKYLTGGESHGPALAGILEGVPARLPLLARDIDRDLARRQLGHGRGARMRIEHDQARILSGVRHGATMGGPIALLLENRDHASWTDDMSIEPGPAARRPLTVPRPGHADLAGMLKYGWRDDLRPVLERASARETAMRTALGAIARRLLEEIGVTIVSHVVAIGDVAASTTPLPRDGAALRAIGERADATPVRCLDDAASARMVEAIDAARRDKDSLGGVVEIVAAGAPPGLGSCMHWDRKLDGRIASAMMSLPAVKGVEIGTGFEGASRRGSVAHDPIARDAAGAWTRSSNHAGGIEGGMSNGEPIVVRVAKKPISTLMQPQPSVDVTTGEPSPAHVERADTCAVPALGVIAEAVLALVLADAALECFGGDSIEELRDRVASRRGP